MSTYSYVMYVHSLYTTIRNVKLSDVVLNVTKIYVSLFRRRW